MNDPLIYYRSHLNNNNNNSNKNTGGLCRFGYERVNQFLASVLGNTRRETQIIEVYANHTMLTPPQTRGSSFGLCRSRPSKIWSHLIRSEKLNRHLQILSFQNPQILRTISSGHDVIHTPGPFPVWSFIMTYDDCRILSARAWHCTILLYTWTKRPQ